MFNFGKDDDMRDDAKENNELKLRILVDMLNAFQRRDHKYALSRIDGSIWRTSSKGGTRSVPSYLMDVEHAETPNDLLMLYKRIKRREATDD